MTLFILTETSAGYALLKAKDKKLLKRDDLAEETQTAEGAANLLKLKKFIKYDSAATALNEAAAITDGKVSSLLTSLLEEIKDEKKAQLAVADAKLANSISKLPGFDITPVSGSSTEDVFRAIRTHLTSLIPGLAPQDLNTMSLGLSHSLSRHKLKFSADKVDTMIVHSIALLDDMDKELNTYAMRVKEWYGWHFPEMAKIINDNVAYARVILKMGMRTNAHKTDFSDILPEEIEGAVKAAAEVSMGTEMTEEDLDNISALAEQVVELTEFRQQLASYLSARMQAIAPNLTALVGELVGARLIAHAGSLVNLAKSPGSTIQILGAEKALFRALKTKHDTPKYGLIYHASLIGQASGKNKGKIARMLASKAALGLRVDSLSPWGVAGGDNENVEEPTEEEKAALGIEARIAIERRLAKLEGRPIQSKGVAIAPNGQAQPGKWEIKEARKYNANADGISADAPAAAKAAEAATNGDVSMVDASMVDGSASESESDSEAETKATGGRKDKAAKKAEKEAKKARKAERAAKRAEKEAKKAAKEAKKKSDAPAAETPKESKKRKSEDEAGEKKKKKKNKE